MIKIHILICSFFVLFGYNQKHKGQTYQITDVVIKKNTLSREESINWQHKDIIADTIPGISLEKAYQQLLIDKTGKEIIVAVLDSEIDINHEELKDRIWLNSNEIPDNGKDDDKNGYTDDIYGWNFLGNDKGENIIYEHAEYVRIIKKYKNRFKQDTLSNPNEYALYKQSLEMYEEKLKDAEWDLKVAVNVLDDYMLAKTKLQKYFPNEDYTLEKLNSIDTTGNGLGKHVKHIATMIKFGYTEKDMKEILYAREQRVKKSLNLDYDDRAILEENPDDIADTNYGNANVSGNLDELYHGSLVAGLIAANRDNGIGIEGVANNVKIMPVCISANGAEHDKDIALGIKYAVDNGAKVINMSFGKDFSLYKEWVFDAIKYAAKNDVLIVSSAGNSSYNLNEYNNYYPIDNTDNGKEISDNFLLVGSISHTVNENLLSYYSNYGNVDVDVFAPGQEIYTTLPKNEYKFDSGTSLASAITSGVAALLRSYYPDLSASQVKHILMESGVAYNIMVNVPGTNGKEQKPFSEFSKSGKVVNAYNALLMAEKVAKKK